MLTAWRRGERYTPVGWVRFGSFRRPSPFSRRFGFDRGLPIDRYYVEGFLRQHAADVRGRVLEFGDSTYTRRFGGDAVLRADVVFPEAGNPNATIVADLARESLPDAAAFDCIICTQTLHLFLDPLAAIGRLHDALRPGGVLLATFPGMSQIADVSWRDNWYWGFTGYSARRLFSEAFGYPVDVDVRGNVLSSAAFLYGMAASELSPAELDHQDPQYHLVVSVRAVRQH